MTSDPFYLDSAYNMGLEPAFNAIPHTSSSLTIEWYASGAGWQGSTDESWAIDNMEVILHHTEPENSAPTADANGPYNVNEG
jgi:hypothetical protein